jgi:hypothetical protein
LGADKKEDFLMIRFSREKRFGRSVKFSEFLGVAVALAAAIRAQQPTAQVEVRTCEDGITYWAAQVTTTGDPDVQELLERRPRYRLEEFSEEVWLRSFEVEMRIHDPSRKEPFAIFLNVNRDTGSHRIMFWYQCVSDVIETMFSPYRSSSWLYAIGDGRPVRNPSRYA